VSRILEGEGLATRITVGSDAEIAFHDVFPTGPGILVLAGTGSMVLGRGHEGGVERVGGWGPLMGDEGSGYDIGRNALRLIARSEDGREPRTDLRAIVLSRTGLSQATDLAAWAASAGRPQVAALAEAVAVAEEVGDPAAAAILDEAAGELLRQTESLVDRLGPWEGPIPMAFVGGLLGPGGPLRSRVEAALVRQGALPREQVVDPVRGAGRMALGTLLQG
jgi:glucosamine kinase